MNRRQALLALLAGAASTEVLGHAFDFALDVSTLSVDEWQARVEDYGHEYTTSMGVAEMKARIEADLTRLQNHLDNSGLAAVTAKMLTLYALTIQSTNLAPASRWFLLGIRAADRSGDTATRVWARGRAALSLTYDGLDTALAADCAHQALAISDRPSVGRLSAQLALSQFDDARRTFDIVGIDQQLSDLCFPEWRVAHITSRLASRSGDERLAVKAQEIMERALPATLPRLATSLELHRALMIARGGNKQEGVVYAREVLSRLPPEGRRTPLQLLMQEIERS